MRAFYIEIFTPSHVVQITDFVFEISQRILQGKILNFHRTLNLFDLNYNHNFFYQQRFLKISIKCTIIGKRDVTFANPQHKICSVTSTFRDLSFASENLYSS